MSGLALLLLCALPAGDRVELRFAPVQGAQVRRTITIDRELGTQFVHEQLRTLDLYQKLGDGRPLLLRRQFDEIQGRDKASASPLAGASVVYTWIPEEGDYGKYYDARESSESALRDLREDLDLRALLPAGSVAVGDAWSVSAAQLRDVLVPAGLVNLPVDGSHELHLTGECKLSFAALRGGSLAAIELTLQVENKLSPPAAATWSFDGRGTLVWDLVAKRAASLQLAGTQKLVLGPQSTLEGKLSIDWRIEAVAPQGQK